MYVSLSLVQTNDVSFKSDLSCKNTQQWSTKIYYSKAKEKYFNNSAKFQQFLSYDKKRVTDNVDFNHSASMQYLSGQFLPESHSRKKFVRHGNKISSVFKNFLDTHRSISHPIRRDSTADTRMLILLHSHRTIRHRSIGVSPQWANIRR